MLTLRNYAQGEWVAGTGKTADLIHAVTGEKLGETSSGGLDFKGMTEYARNVGGPKLRAMTFHERAAMLKAMAKHLMEHKDEFYKLSSATGATKTDSWVDIDGGIGTLFAYSSRGRREFPNETFHVEGPAETLSKGGTFVGRHICVPLEGVAIHINAFNFPCWGMLEKMAPTLLAGVPCIVKPATVTSFVTEAMFRSMVESGIFPEGAIQLIVGSAGDLLDHVMEQDAVAFTGSAATGQMLKNGKAVMSNSVRFNMEADSLNCSILGPDAVPGTEEFDLFIKEVVREMTTKAGQKCTAIRRTIVPEALVEDVAKAIRGRLEKTTIGDPTVEGVRMGPLASKGQVRDVGAAADRIKVSSELMYGGGDFEVVGANRESGSFFGPMLMACANPFTESAPHDIEAFGPVNTIMPYRTIDEAIELAKLGRGSLVGSLITHDPGVARQIIIGVAPFHGRLLVLDRTCAKESTGHGSPLPNLVHGGPGRAGGGEEMGGARGVLHYMQRSAVQGSPSMVAAITRQWSTGAEETKGEQHPFRKYWDDLVIGETIVTGTRTITLDDVVNFANLSGDKFYAHMSDEDARTNGVFTGTRRARVFHRIGRGGIVCRPRVGSGARELRPGRAALHEARVSGRYDSRATHGEAENREGHAGGRHPAGCS